MGRWKHLKNLVHKSGVPVSIISENTGIRGGDCMSDDKKSKNTERADQEVSESCCYIDDPCCCYTVDPCGCYVDPCGCYIDPCCC